MTIFQYGDIICRPFPIRGLTVPVDADRMRERCQNEPGSCVVYIDYTILIVNYSVLLEITIYSLPVQSAIFVFSKYQMFVFFPKGSYESDYIVFVTMWYDYIQIGLECHFL